MLQPVSLPTDLARVSTRRNLVLDQHYLNLNCKCLTLPFLYLLTVSAIAARVNINYSSESALRVC
jgi:hypothetical protein